MSYTYREDVLKALLAHGIRPTERTDPALARAFVRDLYKYEIRRLRERYLNREFAKQEYADRVDRLRQQYPVLAWPARAWVKP